jgi:hypothetical protein
MAASTNTAVATTSNALESWEEEDFIHAFARLERLQNQVGNHHILSFPARSKQLLTLIGPIRSWILSASFLTKFYHPLLQNTKTLPSYLESFAKQLSKDPRPWIRSRGGGKKPQAGHCLRRLPKASGMTAIPRQELVCRCGDG